MNVPVCRRHRHVPDAYTARGGWDEYGDPAVGEWAQLDALVRSWGMDPGPAYLAQTYGGTHSADSLHGIARGAVARDYGAPGVDHVGIARRLEPLAKSSPENLARYGHRFPIRELFCEQAGIRWDEGQPSNFHDSPDHTHAAKVAGVNLLPPPPLTPAIGGTDMSFRYAHRGDTWVCNGVQTARIASPGVNAAMDRTHAAVPGGLVKLFPPALLDGGSTFLDDYHTAFQDITHTAQPLANLAAGAGEVTPSTEDQIREAWDALHGDGAYEEYLRRHE